MIFDLHCDTLSKIFELKCAGESVGLSSSSLAVDEKKLIAGDYMAQCFAAWVPVSTKNAYAVCREMIDIYYSELSRCEMLSPAYTYSDIEKHRKEGKISSILTLEDAAPIENDIEKLRELYELGVRMIGLVWNYPNAAGYPNINNAMPENEMTRPVPNVKDGLTEFGCELVSEMNRLGIVIDVSHLSDAGFYDVAKISKKPFVASHSNSRSAAYHVRNMSDGMLKTLAEHGGVVGVNYYNVFLDSDAERGLNTVNCVTRHVKHIGSVIGYDYIALGSDFDGIPKGAELSFASDIPKLVEGLCAAGFSESVIEKITHENAERVFRECL